MKTKQTHKTKASDMGKIEMAKHIVKYMGGYDSLPKENHPEVKKTMRFKKSHIQESFSALKDARLI